MNMKMFVEVGLAFFALTAASAVFVAMVHRLGRRVLAARSATWRARIRFTMLLAPVSIGVIGVTVALIPSLLQLAGVANDHCLTAVAHEHSHFCFLHGASTVSRVLAFVVVVCGAVTLARLMVVVWRWWRADRLFTSLITTSKPSTLKGGELVFDSDVPVCVTTGLLAPKVYVSSSAVRALGDDCLAAALMHERGHLLRNETRARLVGALAEAFHVPRLGRSISVKWREDAEYVCDEYAAVRTGSASLVAEALVRFQRALLSDRTALCSAASLYAHGAGLDERVEQLLASNPRRARGFESDRSRMYFVAGVVLVVVLAGLQARHIHHAVESFIGVLAMGGLS